MEENTKMTVMAISILPVQQQVAICMSILSAIATSNKDNPLMTKHGFVASEDPIDNINGFLTAMKSACGPVVLVDRIEA